jgi:hypothetical protein
LIFSCAKAVPDNNRLLNAISPRLPFNIALLPGAFLSLFFTAPSRVRRAVRRFGEMSSSWDGG